jgi:hypothetical protein
MAEFLMSSRGRFISGADFLIDGGCTACQQSVNILSIADNDGTICHQLFIGTDIALMVSEVRRRTRATKGA